MWTAHIPDRPYSSSNATVGPAERCDSYDGHWVTDGGCGGYGMPGPVAAYIARLVNEAIERGDLPPPWED